MFAFGIVLLKHEHLLTGGTAGLSVLIHYFTGWPTGAIIFVVNLPFYYFAYRVMGARFTVLTLVAVALTSVLIELIPRWISIASINPLFAAVIGGFCAGIGLLIMIRHKASLGGLNILCIWLQKRFGWRAGLVQLAFDIAILIAGFGVVSLTGLAISVLGAVAVNMVIAVNHRDGRYHAG